MVDQIDTAAATAALNAILEAELSGVVRYTHYSLMINGPNRIPLVGFMKAQATESLVHAQTVGEILTGLGGVPSLEVAPVAETTGYAIHDLLEESLHHERQAVGLYRDLLDVVEDRSIYLEEFARQQISTEELHQLELQKMLRDYAPG